MCRLCATPTSPDQNRRTPNILGPGAPGRARPAVRPAVSSFRTLEWRVAGHRNGRAATVLACRRRVLSSLLSLPRAESGRGGPPVRGFPGLDQPAAGPLPGRGRGGVRAAVPAAEDLPSAISPGTVELITGLRKELSGQGLDAGPHTIAWHLEHHHQVRVSPASVSRYLTRAGLVSPDPAKRPKSSYIRFAADLPNECWQSDFIHWQLAGGQETEILTWIDDHSRFALSVTVHARVTGPIVLAAFRAACGKHGAPASTLTDIQDVCVGGVPGVVRPAV
jgi:hypothetical protein